MTLDFSATPGGTEERPPKSGWARVGHRGIFCPVGHDRPKEKTPYQTGFSVVHPAGLEPATDRLEGSRGHVLPCF